MGALESIAVLVLALVMDIAFGDPPNAFHPVAWLGRLIDRVMRLAPRSGRRWQFVYGMVVVVSITLLLAMAVYFLLVYIRQMSVVLYVVVAAVTLKMAFSLRGLRSAALLVKGLLIAGNDEGARWGLRALVGRDTASLNRPQMVSAVVESVAENSCDSFVAPLFYFLLFGVPGAVAYRVVNTFDSMVGYHGKWEYSGKFAARLDDAVNYVPARAGALLLALAAGVRRFDMHRAWRVMWRDHGLTESPNAGWTIAAAAGALGVMLEKVGHYRIGTGGVLPAVTTIDGALSLLGAQAGIWVCLCLSAEVLRAAIA